VAGDIVYDPEEPVALIASAIASAPPKADDGSWWYIPPRRRRRSYSCRMYQNGSCPISKPTVLVRVGSDEAEDE
jgi:hypothetical protein